MIDFPIEIEAVKLVAVISRIGAFVFAFPFFNSNQITAKYRILFSLALAVLMYPYVEGWKTADILQKLDLTGMLALIGTEIILGLCMSLMVQAAMEVFTFAGSIMDIEIGFSATSQYDPESGGERTVLSEFLGKAFLMMFLAVNGHFEVIKIIDSSFELIGPGAFAFNEIIVTTVLKAVNAIFFVGLQVALPVMASMLMVKTGMAILTRIGQDFPVMILSFAINLTVGMFVFSAILPSVLELCRESGRALIENMIYLVENS